MADLMMSVVVVGMMLVKGLVTVGLSYLGARLAIRHERGLLTRP